MQPYGYIEFGRGRRSISHLFPYPTEPTRTARRRKCKQGWLDLLWEPFLSGARLGVAKTMGPDGVNLSVAPARVYILTGRRSARGAARGAPRPPTLRGVPAIPWAQGGHSTFRSTGLGQVRDDLLFSAGSLAPRGHRARRPPVAQHPSPHDSQGLPRSFFSVCVCIF